MGVCEFVKWFLFALVLSFIGRVLSIMLPIGFDLLRACYRSYQSYSITRRFLVTFLVDRLGSQLGHIFVIITINDEECQIYVYISQVISCRPCRVKYQVYHNTTTSHI